MTAEAEVDIATLYKAAINSEEVSPLARDTAQAVVERLFETKTATQASDLTKRIQQAAGEGNTDLIFELTDELRQAKDKEHDRATRLVQLADDFTFEELLKAFPVDLSELAYDLGMIVLQRMSRKRPARARKASPCYVIENEDGHTMEVTRGVGKPKLPGAEKAFYMFMGFDVSEDGRSTSPATFGDHSGAVVPVAKKALIDDLLAGNEFWKKEGYSIKLKEAECTTSTN